VQILWWLAPPVVATVLAMVWVAWLGREGRGQVDREVAVRRLSEALSRPARPTKPARTLPARPTTQGERSTGVAVRPSSRPAATSAANPGANPAANPAADPGDRTRRAS
jgi:hypothetical protein